MKRFRFPLRPVAVLRAHQDLQAREKFAASIHVFALAEDELARTRVRMRTLEATLAAAMPNALALEMISLFSKPSFFEIS